MALKARISLVLRDVTLSDSTVSTSSQSAQKTLRASGTMPNFTILKTMISGLRLVLHTILCRFPEQGQYCAKFVQTLATRLLVPPRARSRIGSITLGGRSRPAFGPLIPCSSAVAWAYWWDARKLPLLLRAHHGRAEILDLRVGYGAPYNGGNL